MTTPADLSERVLAAITASEDDAKAATPGPWEAVPWDLYPTHRRVTWGVVAEPELLVADAAPEKMADGKRCQNDAAHIARHDPEAVLRRCAADRGIVALHPGYEFHHPGGPTFVCKGCHVPFPCPTLRALARGYGIDTTEEEA